MLATGSADEKRNKNELVVETQKKINKQKSGQPVR